MVYFIWQIHKAVLSSWTTRWNRLMDQFVFVSLKTTSLLKAVYWFFLQMAPKSEINGSDDTWSTLITLLWPAPSIRPTKWTYTNDLKQMSCAIYFEANSQMNYLTKWNIVISILFQLAQVTQQATHPKHNKKTYRVRWEWRYDAQSQLDTYRRRCHSTWRYAAIIPVGFFLEVSR